jgi:MFS family permease
MITDLNRIYIIRFFSNFCQSVFFPFFAVWLLKERIFSPTQAAFVVSVGIFSTRLSAVFLSKWISYYHKKYIIIISLFFISILYALFYFLAVKGVAYFLIWMTISILVGGALSVNSLAILSYIALHNEQNKYHHHFSIINIALNLSSGLGPFLGAMALAHNKNVFPLIPIIFSFLSIGSCLRLGKGNIKNTNIQVYSPFHLGGKRYIFFIILNMLTFIGYAQFYDVFPIYAVGIMSEKIISILFILSSIIIVFAQLPITHIMQQLSEETSILISNLMLAIGTLLFISVSVNGVVVCAVGVIFISLSEVIYAPLYQSLAIKLFEPHHLVLSLAIQSFCWGLAEAAATFLGIYVSQQGHGTISIVIGALSALVVSVICFIKQSKLIMNKI